MRSPSHFVFMTLAACIGLAVASTASAESAGQAGMIDPSSFRQITDFDLSDAQAKAVASRVDERLNVRLAGPSTMECTNNAETGFETCVVRAQASKTSMPAALAQN